MESLLPKNITDFGPSSEDLKRAGDESLKSFLDEANKVLELATGDKRREVKRRTKWLRILVADGELADSNLTVHQLEFAQQGVRDLKNLLEQKRKGK